MHKYSQTMGFVAISGLLSTIFNANVDHVHVLLLFFISVCNDSYFFPFLVFVCYFLFLHSIHLPLNHTHTHARFTARKKVGTEIDAILFIRYWFRLFFTFESVIYCDILFDFLLQDCFFLMLLALRWLHKIHHSMLGNLRA